MKFSVKIPCCFPRLKISIFDFESFSSDESICETTISLDKVFEILIKEGEYSQEIQNFTLYDINNENKENGKI